MGGWTVLAVERGEVQRPGRWVRGARLGWVWGWGEREGGWGVGVGAGVVVGGRRRRRRKGRRERRGERCIVF